MSVIVLGSINMDIVIKTDVFPKAGETVLGNDFYTSPGGKGANQATALGKFGGQPRFIGCVGNDIYGGKLLDKLKSNDVDISNIKTIDGPTGVAVITIYDKDNRIIIHSGANHRLEKTQVLDAISTIDEKTIFLTQFETNIDVIEYGLCLAKERGMYTVLNPAPFLSTTKEIYHDLDLLILNELECEGLVGFSIVDENSIIKAFKEIEKLGVNSTIITLGSQGSILYKEGMIHRFNAYQTEVIDTTCAGDSYIGALLSMLAKNISIEEACDFASKVASLTVAKKGAQDSIPTMKEFKAVFPG